MGSIPFFITKHAYFLPMSWMVMPILGKRLAFQFDMDKAGVKTLAVRLGIKKSSTYNGSYDNPKTKKKVTGDTNNDNSFNPERTADAFSYTKKGSVFSSQLEDAPRDPSTGSKEAQKKTPPKKKGKPTIVLSAYVNSDAEEGLQTILKDETSELKEKFTEFVRSKFATEAIQFYDACVKYETSAAQHRRASLTNSTVDAKGVVLSALGHTIVEKFIKEDSPYAVTMSEEMRNELLTIDEQNAYTPTTFEKPKAMTFEVLKYNFYQQFAKALREEEEQQQG